MTSARTPLIIGHRGAPQQAPENTLASFGAAQGLGVDGVELDVQMSSDGIPVVIHDLTLERTTSGRGPVNEHALAKLRALDAGTFFAPGFARERIPTLREVVELARGMMALQVEIKRATPGIVAATVRVLQECGVMEQFLVTSFHHVLVAEAKELAHELRAGVLIDEGWLAERPAARATEAVALAKAVRADFIDLHVSLITPGVVAVAREHGLGVSTWTVDDPNQARWLAGLGVDRIITNVPGVVLSALAETRRRG